MSDVGKSGAMISDSTWEPCFGNEFSTNLQVSTNCKAVKLYYLVEIQCCFQLLVQNIPLSCHVLDKFF